MMRHGRGRSEQRLGDDRGTAQGIARGLQHLDRRAIASRERPPERGLDRDADVHSRALIT